VTKDALFRDGVRCSGRQPWEPEDSAAQPCESHLVGVQRGATGNYIAERVSALDIPEEKSRSQEIVEKVRSHDLYQRLVDDNGGPRSDQIAGWIAEELGASAEAVLAIALAADADSDSSMLDLKDGEWAAFVKKLEGRKDRAVGDFVVDGWEGEDLSFGPTELP
jgi:hypothetical protein